MTKSLILITGIPCSGKSLLANRLLGAPGMAKVGGMAFDDTPKWRQMYEWIGDWFRNDEYLLIVDAPLNTVAARLPLVSMAKGAGVHLTGIHARAPLNMCMDRDTQKQYAQSYFLSQNSFYTAPSKEEGFDQAVVYNATSLDALTLFVGDFKVPA